MLHEKNGGAHFDYKEVVEEIKEVNELRRSQIMQRENAKKAVREEMRKKLYARRLSIAPKHLKWNGPSLFKEEAKPERTFDNEGNETTKPFVKKKEKVIPGSASHSRSRIAGFRTSVVPMRSSALELEYEVEQLK